MKGITPIIAIIVLLLITLALAGAGWTYISTYTTSLTAKQVVLVDSFCVGTDEGKIIIRNAGMQGLSTSEMVVLDPQTGDDLTDSVYWGEIRDTDVVLEYRFEETSGDVKDNSGRGKDATAYGDAHGVENGKMGRAYDFDGSGDYLGATDVVGNYTALSVSFWMKPSVMTQWDWLIGEGAAFRIGVSDTDVAFWIRGDNSGGTDTIDQITTTTVPIQAMGEWYHIACTWDGTATDMRIYVNGELEEQDTKSVVKFNGDSDNFAIGDGYSGQGNYFDGLIDEVKIYERVLSPDEARALYESVVILPPGENAVMSVPCTGRCDYRIIMGGRSFQAAVVC